MAEICCGTVSESGEASSPCEPSSRAARRRRMEIRRFKFIAGVSPEDLRSMESCRKRQKTEALLAISPRHCENAVENCAGLKETATLTGSKTDENSPCFEDPETGNSPDRCPRFGMLSVCGRRRDMEDAVSIIPSFSRHGVEKPAILHFFGVYDGHGCSHVAMSCRDRLHKVLAEALESSTKNRKFSSENKEFSLEWKELMEKSFSRMDKEVLRGSVSQTRACRCELRTPQSDTVGSTAIVAVVDRKQIVVANCGDSRAVLCRQGKAIPLSTDHKPDRPDELLRIQAAGGRVIYWDGPRVLGVLAMSRAIGDNYLKPYVTSSPEVTITERSPGDDCLILASDGLWDVVSNGVACDIARRCLQGSRQHQTQKIKPETDKAVNGDEDSDAACSIAAALLTKLALARHSSDNVSVVVIDLKRNM